MYFPQIWSTGVVLQQKDRQRGRESLTQRETVSDRKRESVFDKQQEGN